MASVITMYCAGTEYDSKSGDIVAWLNANTRGTRGKELFFFPGPGSGEYADSLIARQVSDAARDAAKSTRVTNLGLRLAADTTAVIADVATVAGKKVDAMTGGSLHDRIRAAVQQLRDSGASGSTINLVGWSRGAVTCVGIAYALAQDALLRTCTVNLFLFDPVPGPEKMGLNGDNWAKELSTLRSNIGALAVVLMENEDRDWMMAPLTKPFTECSNVACGEVAAERVKLYPMPGVHSSSVQSGGAYAESATIGAHLVSAFLLEHGTPVSDAKVEADVTLVDLYGRLKQKRRSGMIGQEFSYKVEVKPVGGFMGGMGFSETQVVKTPVARQTKVPNALRSNRFFVNEHHRTLFRSSFPRTAWILDPGLAGAGWSAGANVEVSFLKSAAPNMAQVVGDGVADTLAPKNACIPDEADLRRLLEALGYQGPVAATFVPTAAPAVRFRGTGGRP